MAAPIVSDAVPSTISSAVLVGVRLKLRGRIDQFTSCRKPSTRRVLVRNPLNLWNFKALLRGPVQALATIVRQTVDCHYHLGWHIGSVYQISGYCEPLWEDQLAGCSAKPSAGGWVFLGTTSQSKRRPMRKESSPRTLSQPTSTAQNHPSDRVILGIRTNRSWTGALV